jgi:small-conductance mechanosensitive channel
MLKTILLVSLWALAGTFSLSADEKSAEKAESGKKDAEKQGIAAGKETSDAPTAGPEARLRAMMQQMEKMQRAIAEQGQALSAGEMKERQQKMLAEMKKMQEEMMRQMQQRGFPMPQPGALGAPVDPSSMALQHAKMMLQSLENAGGSLPGGLGGGDQDPAEIGQKMVLAGLDVQLHTLAARINAATDKEAKQKLTAEFREIIDQVVTGRKKLRERTIQQLEKRLADLKKNAEKDETAEQMAQRLLEGAKGPEQASADDAPTKEAKKPDAKSSK